MADFLKDPKNGLWIALLILFLTFYGPRTIKVLPEPVVELFEKNWFRAFIVFVAVYLAQQDIKVSLVITVVFLLVTHSLQTNKLYESFLGQYGDVKENFVAAANPTLATYSPVTPETVFLCSDILPSALNKYDAIPSLDKPRHIDLTSDQQSIITFAHNALHRNQELSKFLESGENTKLKTELHKLIVWIKTEVRPTNTDDIRKAIGQYSKTIKPYTSMYDNFTEGLKYQHINPINTKGYGLDEELGANGFQSAISSAIKSGVCNPIDQDTRNNVYRHNPNTGPDTTMPLTNGNKMAVLSCVNGRTSNLTGVHQTTIEPGADESRPPPQSSDGANKCYPPLSTSSTDNHTTFTVDSITNKLAGETCMHSGQCCGYKGDDPTNVDNTLCINFAGTVGGPKCVKVGTGAFVPLQNTPVNDVVTDNPLPASTFQGTTMADFYDYKKGPGKAHLSPYFPVHEPSSGTGHNWCNMLTAPGRHRPCENGSPNLCCDLNWNQPFFELNANRQLTTADKHSPGANTPKIIKGSDSSGDIGTGSWVFQGSATHADSPQLFENQNERGLALSRPEDPSSNSIYPSFNTNFTEHFLGGSDGNSNVHGQPVAQCDAYSKDETTFTGTATYPMYPKD